ncbi:MAG: hypothetical protein HGA36_01940 [Candidatus Moranbacteria bacterium]|nr:hypothetical protein [Candidatus Moranbacteria bacterium]
MVNVEISLGKHTINVPYGMRKLFMDMIASLNITQGNFKVHLSARIRGIRKNGIKFVKLMSEYNAMSITAQSSGKDGRHICILYFPDMYKDQLTKFGDDLKERVGQEDLAADEIIEDEKQDATGEIAAPVQIGIESAEAKQQRYLAENLFLNTDMLTLIAGDILEKKGTGWVTKGELFKLLRNLNLDFPSNKLIGKLLSLGYLEKDPEQPDKRSRLTPSACLLVNGPSADTASSINIVENEDVKILSMFDSLKTAAADYSVISKQQEAAVFELKNLIANSIYLEEKLEKITKIIQQRMVENQDKLLAKKHELKAIGYKITPRMTEANRRLELMFSDLPE